jgi:co-chaperonin GroES (HSP10)
MGQVIRVGAGIYQDGCFVEPEAEVGDLVYMVFVYNQPIPIDLNGQEYILVRSRDIVGRVDKRTRPEEV